MFHAAALHDKNNLEEMEWNMPKLPNGNSLHYKFYNTAQVIVLIDVKFSHDKKKEIKKLTPGDGTLRWILSSASKLFIPSKYNVA